MGIIRSNYTNSQVISITLASLADQAVAVSQAVDNSVLKFISADIQIQYKTGISISPIGTVDLFLGRSVDGGTTYDDSDTNAEMIGSFTAGISTTSFVASTDTSSTGQLPDYWKLFIKNNSGTALDANPVNFYAKYNGKRYEST